VVSIVSESLAVARDTGGTVLQARTAAGLRYDLTVPFRVVPRWSGQLVWSRQAQRGEQPGTAVQHLPHHDVVQVQNVGYAGTSSGDPSVSWDGSRVAVTATRGTGAAANVTVFVVDLPTGHVTTPLNALSGHQFGATWFPRDTLLAFLMATAKGVEVFTARPDGSGLRQRTSVGQGSPPFFEITRDQTLVLGLRETGTTLPSDLFEVALSGDTVRRLTTTPEFEENRPAVSPNGKLVAYNATRVDDDFTHVWIMNRDGSAPRRLLPDMRVVLGLGPPFYPTFASSSSPSWTPDGEWVLVNWNPDAFLRPDGKAYEARGEIYAIRVADGLAVRLTRSANIDIQPVFR
jgi:hypothetical protein